jgi:DNA-binding response OmpR family regulator
MDVPESTRTSPTRHGPRADRILIVEDDRAIATALDERLTAEGFETRVEHDGLTALAAASEWQPGLVLLDVMLPGLNGVEVCQRLHSEHRVPVLMLTARDDEADMLVGLAVGADDYLTKPFSMREVVARIRAVLRRSAVGGDTSLFEPIVRIADVDLDVARRLVTRAGETIGLTPTEFDLLVSLGRAAGAVRSRRDLLAEVWGYRDGSGDRTVDSHVRSLRRKLGDDVVRTVHGVGYAAGDGTTGA